MDGSHTFPNTFVSPSSACYPMPSCWMRFWETPFGCKQANVEQAGGETYELHDKQKHSPVAFDFNLLLQKNGDKYQQLDPE